MTACYIAARQALKACFPIQPLHSPYDFGFPSSTELIFIHSPLNSASALAANSFSRSSFAAAFPLFGIRGGRIIFLLMNVLNLTAAHSI